MTTAADTAAAMTVTSVRELDKGLSEFGGHRVVFRGDDYTATVTSYRRGGCLFVGELTMTDLSDDRPVRTKTIQTTAAWCDLKVGDAGIDGRYVLGLCQKHLPR
jgi:hypothetical protein